MPSKKLKDSYSWLAAPPAGNTASICFVLLSIISVSILAKVTTSVFSFENKEINASGPIPVIPKPLKFSSLVWNSEI